ncbi:nitrile hydratase subunit beta [Methylobacterium gnaphalii]|uniref:Nitrile hydratase subunit beta n=1 Tax=Methylobacterium gnaphalii TaxID=1010610 RepID=A0A512JM31_9HYPH|nr:nitrile hydratase subunit beta [Methylobacterium gnaphalii]GEP11008.1 nitrile hydratase [Methylobacterium gnaphalii]GJD69741.1 Low-molecular weight cobalt-containing nitrile hydratase subunit beta [Methylobacterium gnaphalii]GLS50287.1 nitrile hydratase [Methylobacterium gnaphalii]
MNGAQDLGGAHGFGPVEAEANEPVFHAEWERRVFALAMAMGFTKTWTLDASRAARESLPPVEYLSSSYYEIWLRALETQLAEHGLASPEEMRSGTSRVPPGPVARVLQGDEVAPLFDRGFPSDRPPAAPARFAVGDRIIARNRHPLGHTRLPRFVRGRPGIIERVHGAFVFPEAAAEGRDAPPQWLYTAAFAAEDLWGESADPGGRVTIAAFESYLEPSR